MKFLVKGMSCASCQASVEKAISKVRGVSKVEVSLLTNSMEVEGLFNEDDVIKAVKKAGFEAVLSGDDNVVFDNEEVPSETRSYMRRFISSAILLVLLMIISIGHVVFHLKFPGFLNDDVLLVYIEMFLALAILCINYQFFVSGFKAVLRLSPNMDTLVSMGAGVSFIYSIFKLPNIQYVYFEASAVIVTLVCFGKVLESYSKGQTTEAIKSLIDLAPKKAKDIKVGDIFEVKPGESFPADGIIVEGSGAIDESMLTGESIPVDKIKDNEVYAGTINVDGYLKCKATKVGYDTMLSRIIKLVSDASASKAPIARAADKISAIFVPLVIIVALITFVVWLILGQRVSFSLQRAVSVLVISCPCALGLATPVAIMVGNGVAAKCGALFKNAKSLELTGKVKNILLDKTGTITTGKMHVTDVLPIKVDEKELLSIAYAMESRSEHPLSKAIAEHCSKNHILKREVSNFNKSPGNGLTGIVDGRNIIAGNSLFVFGQERHEEIIGLLEKYAEEGKTPIIYAEGNSVLGIIAVADQIKTSSRQAVKELKNMGINVVMLTGDNEFTAKAIAKQCGIENVAADILPEEKNIIVERHMKDGVTMMVGDGINDAPALTVADVGVSLGSGTDIAIESSDVVVVNDDLFTIVDIVRLCKRILTTIHQNLFWAFLYNVICIPLAIGVFAGFGFTLTPMICALCMSLSSVCVVLNALRLKLFKRGKK